MADTTLPADETSGLPWDAPTIPHEYANVVVVEKTVVLVRHHFANAGNVEKIYSDYINEKVAEFGIK